MPSTAKILKDEIVYSAYKIVKDHGVEAMTTRAIAQKLKCSVQPIYYAFENLDNLRDAVLAKAMQKYTEVLRAETPKIIRIKAVGLNFIRFARDYPNLFRFIFYTDRQENTNITDTSLDANRSFVVQLIQEEHGVSAIRADEIYIKMGIFCHGIASMVMAKTAKFTDADVERLISELCECLVRGCGRL